MTTARSSCHVPVLLCSIPLISSWQILLHLRGHLISESYSVKSDLCSDIYQKLIHDPKMRGNKSRMMKAEKVVNTPPITPITLRCRMDPNAEDRPPVAQIAEVDVDIHTEVR